MDIPLSWTAFDHRLAVSGPRGPRPMAACACRGVHRAVRYPLSCAAERSRAGGRGMREVLDPWANPVTFGVPFFLLAIALEVLTLKRLGPDGDVTGYQGKDAATSLLMGAGSLVTISAVKVAGFVVYTMVYAHVALWHL